MYPYSGLLRLRTDNDIKPFGVILAEATAPKLPYLANIVLIQI